MVQADMQRDRYESVLEAKTFLIARAAKRIYQRIGERHAPAEYQQALLDELEARRIRYQRPESSPAGLDKMDVYCFDGLVLRITADADISKICDQVRANLKARNYPVGLVVGFGHEHLIIKRVVK